MLLPGSGAHPQACPVLRSTGQAREFVSAQGLPIHADINGSFNILRKALPSAFARGIKGVVVRPLQVQPVRKTGQLAVSMIVNKASNYNVEIINYV